ncbi:oligoendopeptidase F [Clostridium oryzae]|uniref:Oligopeptidase F n=1 Tax=Clostridium oryzae TaxID=1450648 RepID=A0A1V4IRE5_9CLOT|nr:oligoendopeptidase F [Clostridium oryzae]OPJ62390.1 oligoendopeptidase F, plasmid [Clostridium oryzae]
MSQGKIPKRSEIADKFKWKLEDIYADNELWEKDFSKVKEAAKTLETYKGSLGSSGSKLLEVLDLYFGMRRLFEKVYVYAHMRSHEDTTNSLYQGFADRADALSTEISSASSYITPEILDVPEEKLNKFISENSGLELYRTFLNEILRNKPHVLSAEQEQILAMTGEVLQSASSIYNMINNADIKFPTIKDENNEEKEITKGRYIPFMECSDRRVRKDAFEGLYSTYMAQKNTFAATLSSNAKADMFRSKARKFSSAREAYLFEDNVSTDVYDNLISTIHSNMNLMYRYVKLRKKMLKLDELHMYDLYTPIVQNVSMKIPYDEAVETVKKALAILGPQYIKDLTDGFNSGWIDIYENEGKRSGAYSWGCYDSHPYVLLNHTDTLDNMFTIAHEMGHSMHTFYSNKKQPYQYAEYKIFVAEVASTFNESILMNYMLKNTTDKTQKMYLLNHYMESFRGTVYRQTMFAEFEKIVHEMIESGKAATAESLCRIYHDLNVKYFGNDIVVDDYIDIEWARIPHFYSSFYVYKYATGFSAATSLSTQVLNNGEPALKKYLNFLTRGGSDYPLNLLKDAGVDMSTPKPIEDALKVFESVLDQFESLI